MKRITNVQIVGSLGKGGLTQAVSTDSCISLIETTSPGPVAGSGTKIYFNGVSGSAGNLTSKKDGFSLVYFADEGWVENSLFGLLYTGIAELMKMNINSVAFLLVNRDMWKYKAKVLEWIGYSFKSVEGDFKEGHINTVYLIVPEEHKKSVSEVFSSIFQLA